MARKTDHPAVPYVSGIMSLLDHAKGKEASSLLGEIRKMAIDALDVLSVSDPRAQRIATVLLVLRQCTSVETKTIRGRTIERVTILDQQGYGWAMGQVHQLGAA